MQRAVDEIERGECGVPSIADVDRWAETGVPPWLDYLTVPLVLPEWASGRAGVGHKGSRGDWCSTHEYSPARRRYAATTAGVAGTGQRHSPASGVDGIDMEIDTMDADALARARHLGRPASAVAPTHFDASLVLRDEHVLL